MVPWTVIDAWPFAPAVKVSPVVPERVRVPWVTERAS
jgi:hypothetical protein